MYVPPPSSFPPANYTSPETRGPANLIVVLCFFPISVLFVFLRVYTRVQISKSFGTDDLLLLLALLPTATFSILICMSVMKFDFNRHSWDVPTPYLSLGLKFTMATEVFFALAAALIKLSMLTLTRRIMSVAHSWQRWAATAGIVIVVGEFVAFLLVVIFTCLPVSAYWTLSPTPQHCINEQAHLTSAGIINSLTDILVVALPIPTVMSLKVNRRQQVIMVMLFSAGFLACIAGLFRCYYLWIETSTYDRSWESFPLWIASTLEIYIGLICASIPATKMFFSKHMPDLMGSPTLLISRCKNATRVTASSMFNSTSTEASTLKKGHRSSGLGRFSVNYHRPYYTHSAPTPIPSHNRRLSTSSSTVSMNAIIPPSSISFPENTSHQYLSMSKEYSVTYPSPPSPTAQLSSYNLANYNRFSQDMFCPHTVTTITALDPKASHPEPYPPPPTVSFAHLLPHRTLSTLSASSIYSNSNSQHPRSRSPNIPHSKFSPHFPALHLHPLSHSHSRRRQNITQQSGPIVGIWGAVGEGTAIAGIMGEEVRTIDTFVSEDPVVASLKPWPTEISEGEIDGGGKGERQGESQGEGLENLPAGRRDREGSREVRFLDEEDGGR